tara:strand:- start:465 stop:1373 length:909 start_codon:yes stop_codon:yes gene_type:complete
MTGPAPVAPHATLLYIVGAQKAATTWLHKQFRPHPQVARVAKELHYWDTVRPPFATKFLEKRKFKQAEALATGQSTSEQLAVLDLQVRMLVGQGVTHDDYMALMSRNAHDKAVMIDNTPSYALLSRLTFAEMCCVHPKTRFLFILREPVARLVSNIRNRFRHQIANGDMPDAALDRQFAEAGENRYSHDFRRSNYLETMRELEAAVPASQIHYEFYESLFHQTAFDRITDFMGIGRMAPEFGIRRNATARKGWVPGAQALANARKALDATYADVAARFGTRVPAEWQVSAPAEKRTMETENE